jgi:3-polyprenyl-4-hydroxybenzoate decarboxylase
LDGNIQLYDEKNDCFILINGSSGVQYAVHFNQFTVEEEQNQLVLKVMTCSQTFVPEKYTTVCSQETSARTSQHSAEGYSQALEAGQVAVCVHDALAGILQQLPLPLAWQCLTT